ncbi:arf-GAP with Rho-GAP domain, ANK repeat and PH domain-containing protein 1 [Chanos chanos]|uniref:Arf-GAP with Rho-GAP domain, ANK repeat and PH domain-containing protein 1 n=1 Tax=Chanos chanos TaxID=29144 RepID=A0A6J2W3R6_CHACN|nr:arf-GAP with Rho-GAP domain, ANK repeat and PH domain-containing protein 1-like [Chanos chanos]
MAKARVLTDGPVLQWTGPIQDMQECFRTLKDQQEESEILEKAQIDSIELPCFSLPDSSENQEQGSSFIKCGWLDKTPPHGGIIFQKRWVQLDDEYLRYFQNEEEVYSKRMISLSSLSAVDSLGDVKFEVISKNRTFLFRASSSQERNEWVSVLQEILSARYEVCTEDLFFGGNSPEIRKEGYLDMTSPKAKLYVVVCDDQVYLFRNAEEYQQGVGITSIDMKMGSVKAGDKKSFTISTPYRTFSFVADSEKQKQEWFLCLQACVSRSLSCDYVAEIMWSVEANRYCADCNASKPEWASVNLCVLVCERCAGVHRSLGAKISKIRSLKMDEQVWTDNLVKVFLSLGNGNANLFWAANVPPSENLSPSASTEERKNYISSKYTEGKYRRYHSLYGQQQALNNALCRVVQTTDVLETLSLLYCGAQVNCYTGVPECPTPLSLAQRSGQKLQTEFLLQNQNTECPGSKVNSQPNLSNSGYLHKVSSLTRPITDRKAKGEFTQRWCSFSDGLLTYYRNEKSSNVNGKIKASDIVCLAINAPGKHGFEHTFEVYTENGRLYLFGTDDSNAMKKWVRIITKSVMPPGFGDIGGGVCDRLGRLNCPEGSSGIGWFCLSGSTLQVLLQDTVQNIDLRKLHQLTLPSTTSGAVVLVWRGGTIHLEQDRRPHFPGWISSIQSVSGGGDQPLSQQQLTDSDIPVVVHRCVDYITHHGLTSDGIYRKSGINSKIASLMDSFRNDARSVCIGEEFEVDDVANALKRYLREVKGGVFTSEETGLQWLEVTGIQEKSVRISTYQSLLKNLPEVNCETLRTLLTHLHCIQHLSKANQMTGKNLAIVFGPTLFQMDGSDRRTGLVVEDLIQNYCTIFNVSEEELQGQLDLASVILDENLTQTVATASATEIASEILNHKETNLSQNGVLSCHEAQENADMGCRGSKESSQPILSHSGYLHKVASTTRPITDRKAKGEFTQRWCSFSDGLLTYHRNEKSSSINGKIKASEILCLAVNASGKHGFEHTFEVYTENGRLYLFGTDNHNAMTEWISMITKSVMPPGFGDIGGGVCDRLGCLNCPEGSSGIGWFCLSGSTLQVLLQDTVQNIDLRKLHQLTLPSTTSGAVVLVWRGGTIHLEQDRRPHFPGWISSIQSVSGGGDQPLSQQQLTDSDIPVVVHRCVDYITRHGLMSDGIYRKSGVNSKVTALLDSFRNDARSVCIGEEFGVDDVASTLKSVQHLSETNQMTGKNLAIVFGPTLFQVDGSDRRTGLVVEDLIQNYCTIFNVPEEELQKQLDATSLLLSGNPTQGHRALTPSRTVCAIYLEKKDEDTEVLIPITASTSASQLVSEVLDHKGISLGQDEVWSCYEVYETAEIERALHYQEKVLPLYYSLTSHSHLVVKRNNYMNDMTAYLESKRDISKCGTLRVCEVKGGKGCGFNTRYCELASTSFRLFKEAQSGQPEKEWSINSLKMYQGYNSKLQPPTPWGLTLVYDTQHWYLCCDFEDELIEWSATFMSLKYNGDVWPPVL